MIITTYSFRPFPKELRTTFELPAWPYNEEFKDEFTSYMHELTVFRYEDSEVDDGGRNINHPINFPVKNYSAPFTAFYNHVAVSDDALKVIEWPQDRPSNLLEQIKEHPTKGDLMAWFSWNIPVTITHWNEETIGRIPLDEYIDSNMHNSRCYQTDANLLRRNKNGR